MRFDDAELLVGLAQRVFELADERVLFAIGRGGAEFDVAWIDSKSKPVTKWIPTCCDATRLMPHTIAPMATHNVAPGLSIAARASGMNR